MWSRLAIHHYSHRVNVNHLIRPIQLTKVGESRRNANTGAYEGDGKTTVTSLNRDLVGERIIIDSYR